MNRPRRPPPTGPAIVIYRSARDFAEAHARRYERQADELEREAGLLRRQAAEVRARLSDYRVLHA